MAYRVRFSPDEALGAVELSGVVRWGDIEAAFCSLFTHPAWSPSTSALWDASAVAVLEVSPDDLPAARRLQEATVVARSAGRSAVVTGRVIHAGLLQTLFRLGPHTDRLVEVFGDRGAALAFLGLRALPEGQEVTAEGG